ncbi:MAG: ACR3 family arsenite efflux transporter [Deltaproteobacteria bacterium]|nr:ACR3 family arsenite efflux transporter [Deltaproteobacteria bacterium]
MAEKKLSIFERYLTVWVLLCIAGGISLGKAVPDLSSTLNDISLYQVSVPIAVCLFFMMYPIMVKIDFTRVATSVKTPKPVLLTLFINWAIKPFTMFAISYLFLGYLFRDLLPGTETLANGKEVELWRSYIAGTILLGIAPCTAMVLVWGYLAKGNDGLTLVLVAVNSLLMLFLYGPLGGLLLNINSMPVPWRTMLFSVSMYVALPLLAGSLSRRWIIKYKGMAWFNDKFLHRLTPMSIAALLITLLLLFSLKGEVIMNNPLIIVWIAVPLFIQTVFIFVIGYFLFARWLKLSYHDAAPAAMISASNHFEVAIATAVTLFGLSSGAALATVVGVLIEVPLMLMLVSVCKRTCYLFKGCHLDDPRCKATTIAEEVRT